MGERQKGRKLKWAKVEKPKVERGIKRLGGCEGHKPRQVGSLKMKNTVTEGGWQEGTGGSRIQVETL